MELSCEYQTTHEIKKSQDMISVFLGAGFSSLGGVPLASKLFESPPHADVILRESLIERVLDGWVNWSLQTGGTPEQYLTHLETTMGRQWHEAIWYVALAITLRTPRVSIRGQRPTITHHTLNLTSGIDVLETFWTAIFKRTVDVSVLTTNYDILAERGLRLTPRSRLPRPGFNYGNGSEQLKGKGYPGVFRSRTPKTEGMVPLLKLHGSVSWARGKNGIDHYHDCRPAIRGDAAIIAPVTEKSVPLIFRSIWDNAATLLRESDIWIIVGYSFPEYDIAINELFQSNISHRPRVHVLNPDLSVVHRLQMVLPNTNIYSHEGLPNSLHELPKILG